MNTIQYIIKISSLLFFIIFFTQITEAQNNALYFMHRVPQSVSTNPAVRFRCRNFIELPVISSLSYAYNNSGFGYSDLIKPGTGDKIDSSVIDLDNFERRLKKRNYIRNDLHFNILGFGYGYRDMFFTLNIANFTETRVGFPKAIVSFKDGNWDLDEMKPIDLDLSGFEVDATNYTAIALGASKQINGQLRLGAKIKYIMGAANANTRKSYLMLNTEDKPIKIAGTTHFIVNASFPMTMEYDTLNIVEDLEIDMSDPVKSFVFNGNRGAAIDLGMIYEWDDKITLAASLIDLGFISWKNNVNNMEAKGNFELIGFDFDLYNLDQYDETIIESLLDSLENALLFEPATAKYKTLLTPKLYIGGTYDISEKINVGVLTRTDFYDNRLHPSVTLSLNAVPLRFLNLNVNYSFMNNSFRNLGFGLGIGDRGAQFYFVTENIPISYTKMANSGLIFPRNARTFNFRCGINIIFGCRKKGGGGGYRNTNNQKLCPAYR